MSDWTIVALEQADGSVSLPDYTAPNRVAIVVGSEIDGIDKSVLKECSVCLEIPMAGQKESYNVAQAAAMALYHCRYADQRGTL